MQSSLAILMFVDLVGYSAMMEKDHGAAMTAIRALKSDYLEPCVATHGGEVLKRMGDGWIVAFPTVAASVRCAVEVQTRLSSEPKIALRIGCHVGEVVEDEDDLYGTGLNIAQRVQTEAPPGGFMVSEDAYRQLSASDRSELRDAGTFRLKNISTPVRLYQWRPTRGQGGEVPSIAVIETEFAPRDEDTRALAGDLHDQLLIRMSRRVGVVIFDGEPPQPAQATYLLRSRLRVAGGRGRLSLTLVLRGENRPVWSNTYEGPTEDVFAFCDDILELAENDLRLQTNAFDGDRLAHLPDDQLSVSELRARAANYFYKASYAGWQRGLDLMERAVALNPSDGVALAMRGEAEIMLHAARYEDLPDDLSDRLAHDLDNAVEQSPRSDYVAWARGLYRVRVSGNVAGAEADLKRCRDINPAYLEAHELEGFIRMRQGRFREAVEAYQRTMASSVANPLHPYRMFSTAVALLCEGEFEAAESVSAEALDQRPNNRGLKLLRAFCAGRACDLDGASQIATVACPDAFQPSIVACRPVVPDSHAWLSQALGPQGAE